MDELQKLKELNKEMQDVLINILVSTVHPDRAVRAVMVDLKPIRKVLQKCKEMVECKSTREKKIIYYSDGTDNIDGLSHYHLECSNWF
jgi:gentisate 1,2-dioxygenase